MTMSVENVCRLCLATNDLVYIFDEKNNKLKMKDVILITTGIEIHEKDIVSQKVCEKCYQFIIQIFQFRSQCLQADKYLKDIYMDYMVDSKYYIPNTEVSIKYIVKSEKSPKIQPDFFKTSKYKVHNSVVKLSRTYPEIKLPKACLTSNVAPIVVMEMDQVENYFKKRKLDFHLHVKNALVAARKNVKPQEPNNTQAFSNQNNILILPKATKIRRISHSNKTETNKNKMSKHDDIANSNESRNNIKEVNKISPKTRGKSPKKVRESPLRLRENIEKSPSKIDHCKTDTVSITPNRKRKFPQQTDQDEKSISNEIDTCRSPATRRQRLLAAQNSSVKKILDVGAVSIEPILNKSQQDCTKLFKKQCTLKENLIEEQLKMANVKVDSEIRSPNKKSVNRMENDEDQLLTCVGKSAPLFVCEICNSVQYNKYELKKHQNKHMRCQFCKVRFRSLENKRRHIENACLIRKTMNDLPDVSLVKIEYNRLIRQKYSEAFTGFPPLKCVDLINCKQISNIVSIEETVFKDCPSETLDVIDILSNEESAPPSIDNENNHLPIVPDICSNAFTSTNLKGILRNLLPVSQRLLAEEETQTDLPTNIDISIYKDNRAVFKNLKPYLHTYNIPVEMQPGNFNVTFDYNFKSNPTKKLCLWDDLTPINIQLRTDEFN